MSAEKLVRIDAADLLVLKDLAATLEESMPRVLHRAIWGLKKQIFFDRMNAGYRNLREAERINKCST